MKVHLEIAQMAQLDTYVELMSTVQAIRGCIDQAHSDVVNLGSRADRFKAQLAKDLGLVQLESLLQPMLTEVKPNDVEIYFFWLGEKDQSIEEREYPQNPYSKFFEVVGCLQQQRSLEVVLKDLSSWDERVALLESKARLIQMEVQPEMGALTWDYFVNAALQEIGYYGYRILQKSNLSGVSLIPIDFINFLGTDSRGLEDISDEIRNRNRTEFSHLSHSPMAADLGMHLQPYTEEATFPHIKYSNRSREGKFNPPNSSGMI